MIFLKVFILFWYENMKRLCWVQGNGYVLYLYAWKEKWKDEEMVIKVKESFELKREMLSSSEKNT